MTGKISLNIIVTAGPTREPIDAVRFISNYSTGTMGYELAKEAVKRRHKVILISGPVNLDIPKGVKLVKAETAKNMRAAVKRYFKWCDSLIMTAAVSDYRPENYIKKKMKKDRNEFLLKLVKNPDILKEISKNKKDKVLVGFALETEDLINNAKNKLKEKSLDLIVANKKAKNDIKPFGPHKIDAYLIDKGLKTEKIGLASKKLISKSILDKVEPLCYTLKR